MVKIITVNHIMRIIFVQFFFWTVINAKFWPYGNATSDEILHKSGRLRRAPFHRYIPANVLTATIIDGDKEIHLTWKRVNRFLVNKNLPVYTVHLNDWGPNHKKSNVMKNVGNFIMYHDVDHKSAVIYFENMDKLQGVVGNDYEIYDLSLDRLSRPLKVDNKEIRKISKSEHEKRNDLDAIKETNEIDDEIMQVFDVRQPINNLACHRNSLPERFYVETLLFVTYDVVQYMSEKLQSDYLYALVINYLLHFNAIDMLFASLQVDDFEVYINLAGMIVEEDNGAFSQITYHSDLLYTDQQDLYINNLFSLFRWYPDHFDFPFPKDSFDLMMISTGRELQFGWRSSQGFHSADNDILEGRRHDDRRSAAPIIIVHSYNPFSSFCIAAHQIGKILGIHFLDPPQKGLTRKYKQCYGIMQSLIKLCTKCMRWSEESISQLRDFFRKNPNRCFLLNEPRSLHPFGTPVTSLTPCRQCTCFGYHSYELESENMCPRSIPSDGCDKLIKCKHMNSEGQLDLESIILPFDGTPCGDNMVCWGEQCKALK